MDTQAKTVPRILMQPFIIYGVIFTTGATGLIYQVAWQKYLGRLIGSDSIATAIILGTFLGGLSAGYFICGRLTTWVKNHFKGYAVLEGIIGAWCLCFPSTFKLVEDLTMRWGFNPPFFIVLQGIICSILLMGLPTLCMGGTIPFLTRGLSNSIAAATGIHARVYAVNTAGAFLGTLLSGFYLVPVFGLPITIMGTAVINIGAFCYFYLISISADGTQSVAPVGSDPVGVGPVAVSATAITRLNPGLLYAVVFMSGFYVMTLENVFIRISNLSFGSSSYSFSLVVAVFILAIAIGSYQVGRLKEISPSFLFINQLMIASCLLVVYLTLDTWPYWAHLVRTMFQSNLSGFWGYYGCLFLILLIVLVIPVGFMGATVPIAFHEIKRELDGVGVHSGFLLSFNTLGSLLGSLIGGILFYYMMNIDRAFLSAPVLASLSTILAARPLGKPFRLISYGLACITVAFLVLAPFYEHRHFMLGTFREREPLGVSYDGPELFFKEWQNRQKMLFYNDGPTATVSVVESPEEPAFNKAPRSIVVNGKSDSSTGKDIYTTKLLAHLPALLSRTRSQIMVVGLGTGVTAGELTLYPEVVKIDVAEISPSVVQAVDHFISDNFNVAGNPRVDIHTADAFRLMRRSSKKWDIIVSEPSNPWVVGVDQLFTEEFYRLARQHLTKQGVLVQWFHTYDADEAMMGMIINTVQQQFSQVRLFVSVPGDMILLASNFKHTRQDLENAARRIQGIEPVKTSLAEIDIHSLDAILMRELLPTTLISDQYAVYGLQTMDNPRLHYMAGKQFFFGRNIPVDTMLTDLTSHYHKEYLMTVLYPQWREMVLPAAKRDDLIRSLQDNRTGLYLPMADSLLLKASLNGSYEPTPAERQRLGIDLIQAIGGSKLTGAVVREKGGAYRDAIAPLLSHINRYRNWIVHFPIDGVIQILKEGGAKEKDPYESNWCTMQMALLLWRENASQAEIREVMENCRRGEDGRILVRPWDIGLQAFIERMLDQSDVAGIRQTSGVTSSR